MKFNLVDGVKLAWKNVQSPYGDFDIQLKRPTFNELLQDVGRYGTAGWEARLENVVGWRGVEDASGGAMPFTRDRFDAMCEQIPSVFQQTLRHLSDLFEGFGEDDAKNSETPPASGSAGGDNSEAVSSTGNQS